MNADDMRWLLQTIEDPETAERFVVAQYERGRISYHAMAEIARERGWINRTANEVLIPATRRSTEYGPHNDLSLIPDRSNSVNAERSRARTGANMKNANRVIELS
jgi:hypothetical protein